MNTAIGMKHLLVAALTATAAGLPVHAQHSSPPTPAATPTVAEILKSPADDQDVRLQGRLLRKIGDEEYLFSDGTDETVVEIDDGFPPRSIDDKTHVELRGEVDTGRHRAPEIDVDSVRVL